MNELADLTSSCRDDQHREGGVRKEEAHQQHNQRLSDHDDGGDGQHRADVVQKEDGVDEHADGDKEENGESLAKWQHIRAHLVAQRRLTDHRAGNECTERQGCAEQLGSTDRCAEGDGQRRQDEELVRARVGNAQQQPGDQPAADERNQAHKCRGLEQRDAQSCKAESALGRRQSGQQDQDDHGQQVLHHQPAHGSLAGSRVQERRIHEASQEHHGAGNR